MNKHSKPIKVSLIGPPCVGKGFLLRRAREHYKKADREIHIIGMGDLVRDRLQKDSSFAKQYLKPMADGFLLPDHEMLPMFQTAWNESLHPHVAQEGYFRTPRQVQDGENIGFLQNDCITIILLASLTTCHDRAIDRTQRKSDGTRLDEGKFRDRFDQDHDVMPDVHRALRRTKTKIIQLDANGHLEHKVFPDFLSILQAHWDEVTPFVRPTIPPRLVRSHVAAALA